MANEVKLKLSMEGGKVVAAEIDGVTASLNQTGSAARKAATDLQPTTQSVDKLGVSAKQTAAALRGVPAQFTDIITSLQGGQAPLTVFMQQGGQLKDMFGGAGNAAKALGGYVLGLINPFTIAAAAAGGLAYAWYVGAAEGQAYTRSIILSGNAAGVTGREMAAMAQNIGATTQATVGAAAEAVAAFVGNGNIAGEQIARFSSLAVAMERETGQSVKKTAEQFEDLGRKPVEASVKLNETTHYLTLSVYEQIKALEQQGRAVDAAALAQSAYADAMELRMPKLTENLGYVERAWRGIVGGAKSAWDAMLGVGRQADPVAELQKAIAVREGYVRDNRTGALPTDDAKLNALRQELTYLGETERMTRRVAAEQADANKTVQEKIEFDKRGNAYLSDKAKLQNALNKEIESGRELLASGAITAKQYADRLNDVQASFAKKGAAAPLSEAAKGLALYNDLLDTGSGYTATYAEDQRKLAAAFKSGLIPSYAQYTAAVEILMARQPRMVAREKEHAKVIAESASSYESSAKAALKYNADLANNNEALEKSNAKLAEENALMGLSEESKARLTLARMDAAIATAQEAFALLNLQNSSEIEIATAQRRIDLMKEQRALSGQGIMVKEAMATAAEWKKTADSIRDSLTDAFMSAIDGTKSLWVALRDSVVGMFKNMVLRPIVQGVMSSVVGGIASTVAGNAIGSSITSSIAGSAAGSALTSSTIASSVTAGVGAFWSGLTASGATAAGAASAGLASSAAASAGAGGAFGAGSSLSTTLAAIPGWGWAALGVAALAGIASGRGETRSGGAYVTGAQGKAIYQQGPSGGEIAGDAARAMFDATKTNIQDTLKLVGSSATITGFVAGLESSKDGKGFAYAGGLINGKSFGDSGGRDGYQTGQWAYQTMDAGQAFSAYMNELKKSTLEALQAATDIPTLISSQLAGVNINALDQTGLDNLMKAVGGTIDAINGFMTQINTGGIRELHDLGFSAAAGLIAASGGLEKLQTNLNGYYTNFYSAEEQRLQTIKTINAATAGSGLDAATATRESFRKIVEAQDLTTESGRAMYAALIGVSGAFAGLVPVAESTEQSLKGQAAWQQKLDIATGKTTQREIEKTAALKAADPAAKALISSLYDFEDAAAAAAKTLSTTFTNLDTARTAASSLAAATLEGVKDTIQADKALAQKTYDDAISALDLRAAALKKSFDDAIGAQNDIKAAANKAYNDAIATMDGAAKAADKLYKTASDSIDAERKNAIKVFEAADKALSTSIDSLNKSADLLRSLDSSLDSAMDFFQRNDKSLLARQDAQVQLAEALALAQEGKFPTAESLADAIAAVTQPSEQFFATQVDYQRDLAKTANSISALGKLTKSQLSTEEASLKAMQDTQKALQDNNAANLERLDGIKEKLDLANTAQAEANTIAREALQATRDRAIVAADTEISRLTAANAADNTGLDTERAKLAQELKDALAPLDAALKNAQDEYNAMMGLTKALLPLPEALRALTAALTAFKVTDKALDTFKVANGNTNIASTEIAKFINEAKANTKTPDGSDVVAQLYQYAIANGLSVNQLIGSGALPSVTAADFGKYTAQQGLTAIDTPLTANGAVQQTALNTATTQAAANVAAATPKTTEQKLMDYIAGLKTTLATNAGYAWQNDLVNYALGIGAKASQVDTALGVAGSNTTNDWATSRMGLPAFAKGTNLVPEDMVAQIHKGEAIIPAAFNPERYARASGNDALIEEIKALRAEVKQLRQENNASQQAIATSSNKTAKILERVTPDGASLHTTALT